MFTPRKRILATVLAASAMALPATAGANMDAGHVGNTPSSTPVIAAAPAPSGSGFRWGDAAIGAGGVLLLLSPAGALVLGRRVRSA